MRNTASVTDSQNIAVKKSAVELVENNWLVTGVLFVVVIVSRYLFVSKILYHWDSVNFAMAIKEFDLSKGQPHPPGYIGYVWLTRLVDAFFNNAQTTLVLISVISSALAVVALFFLGKAMFGRTTGLIASVFLAFSPLFWFYGEIALPHTLDALLVIVAVWWLYETMRGDLRYLYPAVIMSAVAGGVRPQTLVFLAPLILFAIKRVGWRKFFVAIILGALICLAWFIPLMSWSGGVARYLEVTGDFSEQFQRNTSLFLGAGWVGLHRNIIKLTLYTTYGWSLAVIPAVVYGAYRLYQRRWPRDWDSFLFLGLWMVPAILFYLLAHMGQQGLTFVYLPGLMLISAESLRRLLPTNYSSLIAGVAAITLVNLVIFTLMPEYPLNTQTVRLLTQSTIANTDNYFQNRFDAIRRNFDPKTTVIVAANWHHLQFYLPEYHVVPFDVGAKWEINENAPTAQQLVVSPQDISLVTPANDNLKIVIFDPDLAAFNRDAVQTRLMTLPDGTVLGYLDWPTNKNLEVTSQNFGLSAN
ncbi:MAG: hypothetical protein FOGNACKC_01599 [Anaerolineae bacterium]|nr:hypothetical protein [Anaerolineae bacterium]